MKKCLRCKNDNSIIDSEHKFHNIYRCLICNYLTPVRIEDCCKSPFLNITIDDKNQERKRLHRQYLNCGGCVDRTKPLSFKKYSSQIRFEFSHHNYEKWAFERNNENTYLWESVKELNFDTSKYAKYVNYIQSEDWKLKRNEALIRDNNLCQVCQINTAEEVHHITYDNLFNEKLEDLLSVCRICHKEIHIQKDKEELIEIRKNMNIKKDFL